jgi:hydrogenase maturation protease
MILVAGIGNIFMGDDAFGVEVSQRMLRRGAQDGVRVVDFGIRGYDLAYALMDDYDAAILVDATARGEAPGTLYAIEPEWPEMKPGEPVEMEAHGMNPMRVLQVVQSLGGHPKRVLVVGCEPETLGGEEGAMGLSATVEAAVDGAIGMIEALVAQLLRAVQQGESGAGRHERNTLCA